MAVKEVVFDGKAREFDEYNEMQIAALIKDIAPTNDIPVVVLEIFNKASDVIFQSILIKLRWSVDKFQNLIDCATQNAAQYPGLNAKIKENLPFDIKTKVMIRETPNETSSPQHSADIETLVGGVGIVLGASAAEFQQLLTGAQMTFDAPIEINKLIDPLQQGLQNSIKNLRIERKGSLVNIMQGREKLCSINVRVNGKQTTVQTEGLNQERLLNEVVDVAGDALALGGQASEIISSARQGGQGLNSLLNGALSSAVEAFDSLSRATTMINLPSKIAGIVRGVCREVEQEYKLQGKRESARVMELQQEIQNALECIACGTPRVDGQSCTSCGYPYKGEKLTKSQIQQKAEEIQQLR